MQTKKIIWILAAVTGGFAAGIGFFTVHYARGLSYLSNDAAACANCHIMSEHFTAWGHSAHKAVARCNDCHAPSGFFAKYASKAENGFWHSLAFTTRNHPDPIRIRASNLRITETACRGCHQLVQHYGSEQSDIQCTHCHAGVGHMMK